MQKTQEVLSGLVAYDVMSSLPALKPPKIEKIDITKYIKCQNFDKASAKFDQKMERVRRKVSSIQEDIDGQKEIMAKAKRETTHLFGAPNDPSAIAKHNQWVDRGSAALQKHNELIDKYNDASEEAKEQLEQLEREALVVIDDDIVATLQRVGQAAHKLANSANASDDLAAIEVCFIGMKVFTFMVDHIEGNAARKDAKDANAELAKLLATLCGGEGLNHITDRYQRNLYLIQNNGELYQQVLNVLGTVDQTSLRGASSRLNALVSRQVASTFEYEGVVDPAELEAITGKIRATIRELDQHCAQVTQSTAETAELATRAASAHSAAEALLTSMKEGVVGLQGGPLKPGDFLCEIVDQETIDDFFARDVKPAVQGLRQHLVATLGEAELDQILTETNDVHRVAAAQKALADADLMKLEGLRRQAPGAVANAQKSKAGLESDLVEIRDVPQQNANRFASEVGTKYVLSFVPMAGLFVAGTVLSRVGEFKAGFSSGNDIYRELASRTAAKNNTMMFAHVGVGVVAGLATLVMALMSSPSTAAGGSVSSESSAGVIAGGGAAVAYLLTALVLYLVGSRLGGYGAEATRQLDPRTGADV